ncbi:SufE family protein [Rhizobiaceae bacterium]|nr:SufE family protein [Rhizobiaceae bacterium]
MPDTLPNEPLTPPTSLEEIIENFELLEDWDDRYGYLIELGRSLTPMPTAAMVDANRVNGCVSQVWLLPRPGAGGKLSFLGASDAHIVSGLVAIALAIFSNRTPQQIVALDEQETFHAIGLGEHLSQQRANGLRALVERIKTVARAAA